MLEENVIFSKIMKACIHNTLAFVNDLKKNHNKWELQSSNPNYEELSTIDMKIWFYTLWM